MATTTTKAIAMAVTMDEMGAVTSVRLLGNEIEKMAKQGTSAFDKMSASEKRMAREMQVVQQKAGQATQLLGNQFGIMLPRAVEQTIAKSKTLGPLMAKAFDASIVMAFGAAILSLAPEIAKYIDGLRGINEELDRHEALAVKVSNIRLGEQSVKDLAKSNAALIAESRDAQARLDAQYANWMSQSPLAIAYKRFVDDRNKADRDRIAKNKTAMEELAGGIATGQNAEDARRRAKEKKDQEDAAAEKLRLAEELTRKLKAEQDKRTADARQAMAEQSRILDQQLQRRERAALAELEGEALITAEHYKEIEALRKTMEEHKKNKDVVLSTQQTILAVTREHEFKIRELREETARKQREEIEKITALTNQQAMDALDAIDDELERDRQKNEQKLRNQQEFNRQLYEEHKRNVQEMSSLMEGLFDDIFSGNIGKRLLREAKKLFFDIAAQWILSIGKMRSASAGGFGGGGGGLGGILGGLLGGLFGNKSGGGSAASGGSAAPGGGTSALIGSLGGGSANQQSLGGDFLNRTRFGGSSANSISTGATPKANTSTGLAGAAGLGLFGGLFKGGLGKFKFSPGAMGALGLSLGLGSILGGFSGQGGKLSGGIGGAIGGAMVTAALGAKFGMSMGMFAGPLGAVVGAAIGGLLGIFGGIFGGRKRRNQAETYFKSSLMPDLTKLLDEYKGHRLEYAGAIGNLEEMRKNAQAELGKLKGEGKSVFNKKVEPAIESTRKQIDEIEAERKHRGSINFGLPQFHEGGSVGGPRSSGEVLALLERGEFVVNKRAASNSRSELEAINRGGTGRPMHITIQAIDAQSVQDWLRRGGVKILMDEFQRDGLEYSGVGNG